MEQTLIPQGIAVVGVGFLGSHLLAALRRRGATCYGVDPCVPTDFSCAPAGLPASLPEQMFHSIFCCMATHGGDGEAYRLCYLESVRELQRRFPAARLIFCSSTSVYQTESGRCVTEASPTRPNAPKAGILLQAEAEVLAHGGVVARLVPLYGEGRCELLRRHLAGFPKLPGPPTRMLNYLHRDDAVSALLCLHDHGQAGRLYNVSGESLAHEQAYRLLEACTGLPSAPTCSQPSCRGAGDSVVDCSRLRALGWAPSQRLANFFRCAPPLV